MHTVALPTDNVLLPVRTRKSQAEQFHGTRDEDAVEPCLRDAARRCSQQAHERGGAAARHALRRHPQQRRNRIAGIGHGTHGALRTPDRLTATRPDTHGA